ncbi:tandem-95 repeat protein [Rhodospirillaceae bacterium KN72]|uniref:Tandem-95 repeat protein n=1 Tax=Pacificispira spongiicola TaxID=2729598 RepID=A0A7Y0DX62_9PROT|nr:LamG-like jellyroll fold domain-containing protein [Pacificispira spongiicola]NMM43240.1 tandem-95 repeat protein [Pacificispira spongiicola]
MADDSNVLPVGNTDAVPPQQQLDVTLGPDQFEGILTALSAGDGIEDAIASLHSAVFEQLMDQGASADSATAAAGSFIDTLRTELYNGNFDIADAVDYARQAMLNTIESYDPTGSVTDPADALLAAIASGDGVEAAVSDLVQQMAANGALPSDADLTDVESVFLDELQAALAQGQDPQAALQTAEGAAQGSIDAMQAAQVPVENPLITALAGGENVDTALQDSINASGGDADAFVEGLENALADGVGAENALTEAEQIAKDTELAKGEAEVELSAADKLAQTLSSGENVDEALAGAGGGDAFADALEQALAGGSTPGDAMNQADEAQQLSDAITQEQSVPLSPADQLAASLASGDNVDDALGAAGGGDAFVDALEQSLADGSTPDAAMADGQQASDVADQTAADQSVPVSQADQLAASLSSGENVDQALADAGGGDAFSDELEAQLASGQSPTDAMNQAGSAQQTADNTASQQSVPADAAATALAQGGDATQGVDMAGAVADATGSTGVDSGAGDGQQPVMTTASTETQQSQEQQPQAQSEPQTQSQTAQSTEEAAQAPTENADGGEATGEGDATGDGVTETIQTAEGGDGTGDETQADGGGEGGSDAPEDQQLAETTPVEGVGGGQEGGGEGDDTISDADIEALQDIATAAGGNNQGGSGTGTTGTRPSYQSTLEDSGFTGNGFTPSNTGTGGTTTTRSTTRSSDDSNTATGGAGNDPGFVNSTPTAVDDSSAGTENEDLTLTVLDNDSDPDGQNLTISVSPLPDGKGEASVVGGSILFKPGTDFDDLDAGDEETVTITYSISDGAGGSDTATVSLLITGTNDAPVITVADSTVTGDVTEQGDNAAVNAVELTTTGAISFVDVDADDTLTIVSSDGKNGAATNGTLTATVSTPAAGGTGEITWIYTVDEAAYNSLAKDQTTTETFTVVAEDSQGATITQDVTVTITGTNDSPTVSGTIDEGLVSEDAAPFQIDLLSVARDVDNGANLDTDSVVVTMPDSTPVVPLSLDDDSGTLVLDPAQFEYLAVGESVDLTVTYNVVDEYGASVANTATVRITGANDAPTVSGTIDAGAVSEDGAVVQIDLLDGAQDIDLSDDLDTSSVSVTSSDGHPVVFSADNETGTLNIDPAQFNYLAQGQSVSLTVNYNVVDGNGGSVANTATLTVTGENDAPSVSLASGSAGGMGEEFNPYTSAAGFQAYPAIGTFADGGYVVVWSAMDQDGSGSAVVTQRFASDGTKVGGETIVNTYTAGDQINTDIAAHADGTYTVVWSSANQDGSGWSAQAQRFNADGTPDGGEFQLNTVTVGDQVHPTVTALPNGGEVITWSASGQDGDRFAVMMRVYDADGNEVTSGPVQMNTTTVGEQYIWTEHGSPISGYPDGSFVAVWSSQSVDGSGYAAVAQRFAADGSKVGGEIIINTTTDQDQHTPAVAILGDGTTVVTWSSYADDGSGWSVMQRLYDADMNPITGEILVNTTDAGDQYFPDVVALTDGGYVIAWTDGSALDGSSYGVYAQEFDASGNPVGSETQLNDYTASEQRNVDLAAKPDGGYFVVWNSYGQDGSDWSAVVREVTPSTLTWPGSVATSGAGSNGTDSSFSYAEAANFTSFPTSEGTVQAWVKTTDTSGTLFSYAVPGSANELWVHLTGGKLAVWLNNTNLGSVDGSPMLDGEWHNVSLSFGSGATDTVLYLDGEPIFDLGSTASLTSGGTLILGADQDVVGGDFESSQSLKGEFDGLRVWNSALTESEIRATMAEDLDPAIYPNLIADYSFDGSLDSNVPGAPTLTLNNATMEDGGVYASGAMDSAIPLAGIVVSDADDAPITLTLSATDGTLFADEGGGSADVQMNGATLVITGSPADVQAALNTATFTGANGFTGTATVTAEVDDGIAPPVSQTVEIAVVDTNTAPVIAGVTAGSVLSLDGSETSKVEIPNVAGFAAGGNTPISVEMWVKPDEVDGLNTIFDKSLAGSDLSTFRVHIDNGNIVVWNGGDVANLGGAVVEGVWQHIAVTYDGTTLTAYVDGVETGSAPWTLGAWNDDPWTIGEDSQAGRNYDGLIDDVRLWSTARTETEIQTYKDAELPDAVNEGDLVFNLTFDGSDGTTVPDISGNGNDGTLVTGASIGVGEGRFGDVTTTITMEENSIVEGTILASDADGDTLTYLLSADGGHGTAVVTPDGTYSYTPNAGFFGTDAFTVQVQDGNGKFTTQQISVSVIEQNHAPETAGVLNATVADFSGSQSYIEVPDNTVNNMSQGTIEAWIYLDANDNEVIYGYQAHGVNSAAFLQIGKNAYADLPDGTVSWRPYNGAPFLTSSATIPTGEWHHVAVTFSGTEGSIYIDGQLDTTVTANFSVPPVTTTNGGGAAIGGWYEHGDSSFDMDGQMGEFRVWDTVRTAQEIEDNYLASMDGTETGLRALYNFSSAYGNGDTITDLAGNYDGTAVNSASVNSDNYPLGDAAQFAYAPGSATESVEIAHAADLDPGTASMTVEMWFYWEGSGSVSGVHFLASKGNTANSSDEGYSIFMNDDTLSVRTAAGGGEKGEMEIDLASEGVTSGWHHVAMVIDQTGTPGVASIQGYLDGSASGWGVPTGYGNSWNSADITAPSDSLIIGNPGSGQGSGYAYPMDEVRVWDHARSEAEIASTMGQELNGNENGLVGYWSFNEGAGTTVVDQTDNGHDGTMSAGGDRENLVEISIANNEVYKGLLFGSDADNDHLSYQIVDGPEHGQVTLDGNSFVYDHDGTGNDSFTVEISDGTDTVTQHIDVTVVV